MSRNDQVTRQWWLLKKLENSRGATLQELAAALPADYSRHPRTIRRDLDNEESDLEAIKEEGRALRVRRSCHLSLLGVNNRGSNVNGVGRPTLKRWQSG